MKYIRTKNGVYEVDGYDDRGVCICNGKTFYRDEYIKQADTIKELCDCLMFVDNDEQKDFLITEVDEDNLNYYDKKNETCYGCIKVKLPNGAIRIEPVAKSNKNGEFELI